LRQKHLGCIIGVDLMGPRPAFQVTDTWFANS
jgi:hypothetical protein